MPSATCSPSVRPSRSRDATDTASDGNVTSRNSKSSLQSDHCHVAPGGTAIASNEATDSARRTPRCSTVTTACPRSTTSNTNSPSCVSRTVSGRRGRRRVGAHHRGAGEAVGGRRHSGPAHRQPVDEPGRPVGTGGDVTDEVLAAERSIGHRDSRGQLDRVLDERVVDGRAADLDHLESHGGLQHPVADLRWLHHTVAGFEPERWALVLVDEVDPAVGAEDHLEPDAMEMHHVGDRSAARNADVRRDEATAPPIGQQVAVRHAGAARAEPIVRSHDRQRRPVVGQRVAGPVGDQFDLGSVRRGQRRARAVIRHREREATGHIDRTAVKSY